MAPDATRGRRKTSVQLQSTNTQTRPKTEEYQRPESKTIQQLAEPGEVCKTSTPGSNPGGASNSKPHENHDLPNRPAWCRPAIWEQLGTIRVRALRSPCGARHRRRACR